MNPPWTEFPNIPMGSAGWRMGYGEPYMQSWNAWYRALPPDEQRTYQTAWCEPQSWAGFYRYIDDGVLPPSVAEHRARLAEPQLPPSPDERRITDQYRALWLIRHFMRHIGAFEVSNRHPSPYLGQREGEDLIGFYEEPNGSWWRLGSLNTGGVEMLRIDTELLRDWKERLL